MDTHARLRHLETVADSREHCSRQQRRIIDDQLKAIISMTCNAFATQEEHTQQLRRRVARLEQQLQDLRRI